MTNPNEPLLPDELLWDGEHLSEIALTALGDGQDAIVAERARDHGVTCEACAARLGRAAIVSMQVGEALRAPVPVALAVRVPVPWLAIIAALLLAVLGSLDSIFGVPRALVHQGPVAMRAASALFRNLSNGVGPLASFACAALLVMLGAIVARSMPRAWTSE
ncbi:MAG: hypothetical protein ABI551_25640 [Polyangiaceae bacterium]